MSVPAPSAQPHRMRRLAVEALPVFLVVGAFLAVWELYVRLADVRPFVLPAPSQVGRTMWEDRSLVLAGSANTAAEFLLGFLLAASAGIALSILIVSLPRLGRGVYPLLVASQTVPVIAVAPLLIIWLGFGLWTKVAVSALISFFPVVVTSVAGFRSVSQSSIDLMRSIPASRWATFRMLMIPSALPSIFAGLKTASVLAVIGAVVGEFVAGGRGLASGIVLARATLRTDRIMALIVALSILGLVFYGAVALCARWAMPWTVSRVGGRRLSWRRAAGTTGSDPRVR